MAGCAAELVSPEFQPRPIAPVPIFENIPVELAKLKQWVLWRYEYNGTKWTKPPYQINGEYAETNRPNTWASYEEVKTAYETGEFDGIGFVLTPPYVGIDLDHCINDDYIGDHTKHIIDYLRSYTEMSPSGSGLHILARGMIPQGHKNGDYEMYQECRYFTITGELFNPDLSTIEDRTDTIHLFYDEWFGEKKPEILAHKEKEKELDKGLPHLEDDELIRIVESSNQGPKFKKLMAGEWDGFGYPSESEARLGLLEIIAWYADSPKQLLSVFKKSGLCSSAIKRKKWPHLQEKELTLAVKAANRHGHYKPTKTFLPVVEIQINDRSLADVADDALEALDKVNSPPKIFNRDRLLTRVVRDDHNLPMLETITTAMLEDREARAASFVRVKATERSIEVQNDQGEVTGKRKFKSISKTKVFPQPQVTQNIMSRETWPFPKIRGVTPFPVIRKDGCISTKPGYDPISQYYFDGSANIDIPESPTQEDAKEAAEYILREVFEDFPFENEASRTHALAGLLSILMRPILDGLTPLFLIDKPDPGTGASLCMDMFALIATGTTCPMSTPPTREEEFKKSITAQLLKGCLMICYDNVDRDFKSPSLSSALTSETHKDRILGISKNVELEQHSTWFATGNNVTLGGDLPRRTVLIRMDAAIPRPSERTKFRHANLKSWVLDNRDELLGKALTIIRAWILAGRPKGKLSGKKTMGSFEEWTQIMDGMITFAGLDGFLENIEDLYAWVDQETDNWGEFLKAAYSRTSKDDLPLAFTTKEFIDVVKSGLLLSETRRAGDCVKDGDWRDDCPRSSLIEHAPSDLVSILLEYPKTASKPVGKLLQKMKDKRFPAEESTQEGKKLDYMIHQVKGSKEGQKVKCSTWKIVKIERGKKYRDEAVRG